jgi:hypothetical protein
MIPGKKGFTTQVQGQNKKMTTVTEIPIHQIAEMTRDALIDSLLHFPGTFKFDFTLDYLQALETDQLRHMLMAAYIHAHAKDRKSA